MSRVANVSDATSFPFTSPNESHKRTPWAQVVASHREQQLMNAKACCYRNSILRIASHRGACARLIKGQQLFIMGKKWGEGAWESPLFRRGLKWSEQHCGASLLTGKPKKKERKQPILTFFLFVVSCLQKRSLCWRLRGKPRIVNLFLKLTIIWKDSLKKKESK